MASTFTIDGAAGPGIEFQAQVFNNVEKFEMDPGKQLLYLTVENGAVRSIDISTAATITVTVSGRNYTVTIAD